MNLFTQKNAENVILIGAGVAVGVAARDLIKPVAKKTAELVGKGYDEVRSWFSSEEAPKTEKKTA